MKNNKTISTYHIGAFDNGGSAHDITIHKKQQPCIHDRVKLTYIYDEYSGLTQGICETANEVCKSVNRPESIIWVKWDNGVELGLIEGIAKYEIMPRQY